MNAIVRNLIAVAAIVAAWVFFFVPNPLLNMLNVQGLGERMNSFVLFVVLPIGLAVISMLGTTGTVVIRIMLTLLVPVVAVIICLTLWFTGHYNSEGLLGAWLYCLPPIVAYIVGTLGTTLILQRSKRALPT